MSYPIVFYLLGSHKCLDLFNSPRHLRHVLISLRPDIIYYSPLLLLFNSHQMMTSSSILTPPCPLNSFTFSATRNFFRLSSASAYTFIIIIYDSRSFILMYSITLFSYLINQSINEVASRLNCDTHSLPEKKKDIWHFFYLTREIEY